MRPVTMLLSKLTFHPREVKGKTRWEVTVHGVDMGGKVWLHHVYASHPDRVRRLVLKVDGHSAWAGLGMDRDYVPSYLIVVRIEPTPRTQLLSETERTTVKVEEVIADDIPVRGTV
jgi:hypothetical protein